ncbi:MAG: helix-turn-helix domain-containing protein [Nitrococcus mobilis]|nr:helix-turn-helix domain-containing protein [Nitrococcus mobilis]
MGKPEKALLERDAKRDLGAELLQSVREMKARKAGRVHRIAAPEIAAIRVNVGLSQERFAELLGVSPRTLQDWEQGRRNPTRSAQTLLKIAKRHPEILREIAP